MKTKNEVLQKVKNELIMAKGYTLSDVDELKPWGAYYRIADQHVAEFAAEYFPDHSVNSLGRGGSLSPKFLIIEPGKQLSFQYHHRRAEIWKVVQGDLLAMTSDNDFEGQWSEHAPGAELQHDSGVRHRGGAALNGEWVVVAEIWQHTDPNNPSDEKDIVRLADDFGRA